MKLVTPMMAMVLLVACAEAPPPTPEFTGDPYGAPLTLTEVTDVSTILDTPAQFVGQTVLIEGQVVEVCEKKGCWMDIKAGDEREIQVKVEDDVIVFPISSRGRTALVEGVVEEQDMTPEQVFAAEAHRAEEQGEPFDSTAVFPARKSYRIKGTGALIRDS